MVLSSVLIFQKLSELDNLHLYVSSLKIGFWSHTYRFYCPITLEVPSQHLQYCCIRIYENVLIIRLLVDIEWWIVCIMLQYIKYFCDYIYNQCNSLKTVSFCSFCKFSYWPNKYKLIVIRLQSQFLTVLFKKDIKDNLLIFTFSFVGCRSGICILWTYIWHLLPVSDGFNDWSN